MTTTHPAPASPGPNPGPNPSTPSTPPSPAAAPPARYRVTPTRVLRSEWHKLRSLRSSWITVVSAIVMVLGVGLIMGGTYTSGGGDSDVDTVVLTLYGSMLGQLCLVVLGILMTAGEYATGMIRSSLTAVPARLPVLWAKAAVFATTVFTVMFATALVTFAAAQAFLHDTDQAASLTDPGILGALAGNATALTLMGLLALGLGALLRSVPGAIGAFIGGVMILPEILGMLPYEAVERAIRYFPTQAAGALGSATPIPGTISPGPALLALSLWAGTTLAAAALTLDRRDV
ncbi:ABC transporter permease [Streptomyces griseus]|uniref:ABC transporter permease n=1 Tax=Streptomyces TaxID=1883 RepID=UPI0001C1BECE|nr:ABC transporter permease [Streptomyces sp. ACT-1]EGE43520.1 putative ABC transporter permease protein [Streptomyces sp. ACT-1]MYR51556.1 ABC transporter permease subunit [Streptomyces sp. SID4928]